METIETGVIPNGKFCIYCTDYKETQCIYLTLAYGEESSNVELHCSKYNEFITIECRLDNCKIEFPNGADVTIITKEEKRK